MYGVLSVRLSFLVLAAVFFAGHAHAQALQGGGSDFQVNTYTTGAQVVWSNGKAVARAGDGSFVVVWTDFLSNGGVLARRFDAQGSGVGPDFPVNLSNPLRGRWPAVASADDGTFVVVWQDDDDQIAGQRFDAEATALGTEFQVSASSPLSQFYPAVAMADDHRFLVAWHESPIAAPGMTFFGRLYNPDGSPAAGGQFLLADYPSLFAPGPAVDVAVTADGRFVAVWDDDVAFLARRFDANGAAVGTAFQISAVGSFRDITPSVDMADDGAFVVAWGKSVAAVSNLLDVGVRSFSPTDVPLSGDVVANTSTIGIQGASPEVAMTADGTEFVVVWDSGVCCDGSGPGGVSLPPSDSQDGSHRGVVGRRFNTGGGAPIGTEFVINTYTTGPQGLFVSVDSDDVGNFVVAWTSGPDSIFGHPAYQSVPNQDGDGNGVFMTRFQVCTADTDADGSNDCVDNCVYEANPDQLNSDCPDAGFVFPTECPASAAKAGCCDGGDVCDVCPANKDNTVCDPDRSGGMTIGTAGGTLATTDGCVTIDVPAGALTGDTSISVTDNSSNPAFDLTGSSQVIYKAAMRPAGQIFNTPITISFCWDDRDTDGIVDRGTCSCPGNGDHGLSCDEHSDCSCGGTSCSPGSVVQEVNLVLKRNGAKFSERGFNPGAFPFKCVDHQAGTCSTATATCPGVAGSGDSTVANCCDNNSGPQGFWPFQTCHFSDIYLGEPAGDLVPGRGSFRTDCVAEWSVNNPGNEPFFDKKGLPSLKQSCTDGDPNCDADGLVNGSCVFDVGVCLNNEDKRLVKRGEIQCTHSDVATWRIVKPRPDSTKPTEASNAVALRDAVLALGPGVISGARNELITFSPTLSASDDCTNLVGIEVPLRGRDMDRKGKATLKVVATPGPPDKKDSDKLKLTCLP